MFVRRWATRLLAVAGLLTSAVAAQAGETVRLVLPANSDAPTLTLGNASADADTLDVRWGGGHFHGGYARGFHGGFYGGYARGFHGGFYGGGVAYRGYYGFRASYSTGYAYYPGYYGYSTYYYYPSYSCYPISQPVVTVTPSIALNIRPATPIMPPADAPPAQLQTLPRPVPAVPNDGTYPYDGGPRVPVPMPQVEPAPAKTAPRPTVPLEGRPVSLPAEKTVKKYVYRAYGEK
jgi:hypothetical protein